MFVVAFASTNPPTSAIQTTHQHSARGRRRVDARQPRGSTLWVCPTSNGFKGFAEIHLDKPQGWVFLGSAPNARPVQTLEIIRTVYGGLMNVSPATCIARYSSRLLAQLRGAVTGCGIPLLTAMQPWLGNSQPCTEKDGNDGRDMGSGNITGTGPCHPAIIVMPRPPVPYLRHYA